MAPSKITRAAVGRFARLGELYDARNDEFLSINGLNRRLEEDDIYVDDLSSVDVDFILKESLDKNLYKLGIDAELGVSIFSGLVKLMGAGSYLNDQKKGVKTLRMIMTYSVRTKHEEIDGIRKLIDSDVLENAEATHIVVGINWGANCNVTCDSINDFDEDGRTVKANLKTKLLNVLETPVAKGERKYEQKNGGVNFSYHCTSDVSDLEKDIPRTFEAAVETAIKLPSVVKQTKDEKGVPISYTLMSLETVRKMCKIESAQDVIYRQIEESCLKECLQIMDKIQEAGQQVADLIQNLEKRKDVVQSNAINNAKKLLEDFEIAKTRFKEDLMKILVEARSNKKSIIGFKEVQQRYLEGEYSPSKMELKLSAFESQRRKIAFITDLEKSEAIFLGSGTKYEMALDLHNEKMVYLMFLNYSWKSQHPENWKSQIDLYFRFMKMHAGNDDFKFMIVDIEMQSEACTKETMHIEFYDKGVLCCKDVLMEEGQDLDDCMIQMSNIEVPRCNPVKGVSLEIRCPDSFLGGKCSKKAVKWICKNCKQFVECGMTDNYLYCKCGRAEYKDGVFRCNDAKHGLRYAPYDEKTLKRLLNDLKTEKVVNILILGETGVGKSTWINALWNYLAYPSLEEAINDTCKLKVLIPSQFCYTSENGSTEQICVGPKSDNEDLRTGQSATQAPKTYKFCVGSRVIRLIDTPGIGDVRGLEQDEKNFENILAHLSYYNEIHGICILLMPNNSRLTLTFKFCITELLTHLHKSAADNIIFCFTNARGTFYKPGDTLPILQSHLSTFDDAHVSISSMNQFCFDNEAFRFLSCLKNNVKFSEEDIATYSSSWDRAVTQSTLLFDYISTLEPHSIRHTISLNNARCMILELCKPLAKTAANIQRNIDSADRKTNELEASKRTASELQDKLYLDAVSLEVVQLGYPRTVCTHSSCVQYVKVQNDTSRTVYMQQCHPRCYLPGIPIERTSNPKLQHCRAIQEGTDGNCGVKGCGHSWKFHMHLTYDLKEVKVSVIDKNIKKLVDEKQGDACTLEKFIRDVKAYIEELRQEQEDITEICAQFGCYLKKNAITPYNDHIDAHLEMMINEEMLKPDKCQNKVEQLNKTRTKYQEKKRIIEEAMKSPDNTEVDFIKEPNHVRELQEKLFSFKHNGNALREIFKGIQQAKDQHIYSEVPVEPLEVKEEKADSKPNKLRRALDMGNRLVSFLVSSDGV